LSRMMEVETLVTVKKILDQQTENFGAWTLCEKLFAILVQEVLYILPSLLTHSISS